MDFNRHYNYSYICVCIFTFFIFGMCNVANDVMRMTNWCVRLLLCVYMFEGWCSGGLVGNCEFLAPPANKLLVLHQGYTL